MRSVLVLLLVLAAAPARADEREDARREFAAGQAADKRGEWQTAIEHYLRANDLKPHPFAIFNIASDYERLGQLREAATWYQRYLEAATDSPDRAKVERTLADLKVRPAKLTVRTMPPGAKVSLDGAPIGVTPYTGVARGGAHHVVVELGGQHDERDLAIEFGEPAEVDLALSEQAPVPARVPGGTYLVVTGMQGAFVTVDGVAAGVLPASVAVGPGPHRVHVEAYGFTAFDGQASVAAGQTAHVEAVMPRALGKVDPAQAWLIGYVLGIGGGADLGGNGLLFDAAFGVRASQYEGLVRFGRDSNGTMFDLIARWAFTASRVTPFLGVGYAYVASGFGYEANGGLRWDVTRSDKIVISLVAEAGLRYASSTDETTGATTAGADYPIQLALELVYR